MDERLIGRGELIVELGFEEDYEEELKARNGRKEGHPFAPTNAGLYWT